MEGTSEQVSPLNLEATIEQIPFKEPAVQNFFGEWCKTNNGIRPTYVDRQIWEDRGGIKNLLEKRDDNKADLYIPKDLKLWEMVDVMTAVDTNTFLYNPDRRSAKKEEMHHLGEMFTSAGIYIAQRIDAIDNGRSLAEDMAMQFYDYGRALVTGEKPEIQATVDHIKELSIPDEVLEHVDKWLAGEEFYQKKRDKFEQQHSDAQDKENLWEKERKDTLAQYFLVISNELVSQAFLDKTQGNLRRAIEKPKAELYSSVFRRAMESLNRRMSFDKLPDSIKEELREIEATETNLREALEIDDLRPWLDDMREKGDIVGLKNGELYAINKIQQIVSQYPRTDTHRDPENPGYRASQILDTQMINCVGASMLGGEFLSELGIDYVSVSVPGHAILFVITPDKKVVYLDMLEPQSNHIILDKNFSGLKSDGAPMTVADIVTFALEAKQQSMTFQVTHESFVKFITEDDKAKQATVSIHKPEYGQEISVLMNSGLALQRAEQYNEAVQAFTEVLSLDPENPEPLWALGEVLFDDGKQEEAIPLLQKAIALDPQNDLMHKDLSRKYFSMQRFEEARETAMKAQEINPDDVFIHLQVAVSCLPLERFVEARKNFEQYIVLADSIKDADGIAFAKEQLQIIDSEGKSSDSE